MLPLPVQASAFEQATLAQELRTVQVQGPGDLGRALPRQPRHAGAAVRWCCCWCADHYPVLDLNAARYRFMERSASDVVALLNAGIPVLEMLEPGLQRRP